MNTPPTTPANHQENAAIRALHSTAPAARACIRPAQRTLDTGPVPR